MLTDKEYKALAVLASRLAESVLMDWDKEEQVKLAKEVACECHSIFSDKESREFVELVKRMREAQDAANRALAESDDYSEALIYINKAEEIEKEVDYILNRRGL
jgi:predicted RNA-binding protein with EMAP domain